MEDALLFANISRYVALTENEWQLILSKLIGRSFKRGEFITAEGEVNRYTNFVTGGSCRTYYIDENGQEHVIQLAIRDWWIGDFPSFITQQPGQLYTEALEEVETISISFDHLQQLYSDVPKLERFFRLITQQAYASFQKRILLNLGFDAEQRYLDFREKYPAIENAISQKHIASYLGMSAEFLSKIKKRIHLKLKTRKDSL